MRIIDDAGKLLAFRIAAKWKEKEKFAKEKDRSGKSVGTTVTGSRHDLSDRRSLYRASLSRGR